MDFQRLFKRKVEGSESPIVRDNARESFHEKEVLIAEGELLDGTSPPCLAWNCVGGTIRVKAEKILGILEGRTRIKAVVLQDLYPGLFERAPNPGTEFSIPLQTVVMQLQDLFTSLSSDATVLEDFTTPFGELAREDEARLRDQYEERPEIGEEVAPKLFMLPQPGLPTDLKTQDESAERKRSMLDAARKLSEENSRVREKREPDEFCRDPQSKSSHQQWTPPSAEKSVSASDAHIQLPPSSTVSSRSRGILNDNIRREGHELLQELYLTDEPLDGSKVAKLILLLPRVAGVVIMLADGAALGGGICGEISETLLNLTPAFVKHLMDFSKGIQEGSVKFVTFSGYAYQLSLTMAGDVVILAGHQGKNLPPGLRERLVATADALSMIYRLPS